MYICICVYINIYVYIIIYVYINIYVYIYIFIYNFIYFFIFSICFLYFHCILMLVFQFKFFSGTTWAKFWKQGHLSSRRSRFVSPSCAAFFFCSCPVCFFVLFSEVIQSTISSTLHFQSVQNQKKNSIPLHHP